jgi:hypothetical protein
VTDIVQQLRDRAYSSKAVDTLCERAADEIERLRLTGMERAAIGRAIMECESMPTTRSREAADTLRALLKRLG